MMVEQFTRLLPRSKLQLEKLSRGPAAAKGTSPDVRTIGAKVSEVERGRVNVIEVDLAKNR